MERGAERLPFSILHTNMAEYDISLDGLNTDPNLRIPENQNPTQNTYFKLDFSYAIVLKYYTNYWPLSHQLK
jgi:hypothetical protein